jgi:hypothetical protein
VGSFPRTLAVLAALALLGGAGWVALQRHPDLLHASASTARVQYQFVDDAGRVRFVDSLAEVPPGKREGVGRIEYARPPSPRARARESGPTSPVRVVLYTQATCGFSRKLIRELDALGVAYENRDIDRDPEARAELLRLTGSPGVPVRAKAGG